MNISAQQNTWPTSVQLEKGADNTLLMKIISSSPHAKQSDHRMHRTQKHVNAPVIHLASVPEVPSEAIYHEQHPLGWDAEVINWHGFYVKPGADSLLTEATVNLFI